MARAVHYRRILALVALTMLAVVTSFSQTPADVVPKKPVAIKFAELGATESCEFREGVRGFMNALSNNPGYQGYIANYGTNHEIGRRERLITNKIAFRQYDRSRITLVRGGFKSRPATELWLMPPGADYPEISGGGEEPPSSGSTGHVFNDRAWSFSDIEDFVLDSIKKQEEAEREKTKEEAEASKMDTDDAETPDEEDQPDDPQKKAPKTWRDLPRFRWADTGIEKVLSNTTDTTVLIIFYADDKRYDITKLTGLVEEARTLLAKDGRIPTSRLEVKFGGYREEPEVEFWVLEPKDTYPRPRPDERCPDSQPSKK